MKEERFEIKNQNGLAIRGKISFPDGPTREPQISVMLLHGFKAYMEYPTMRLLAEQLAASGYPAIRFDATNGVGDSDGDIYHSTVTGYLQDVSSVLDFVARRPDLASAKSDLALFGTSMGGLVAVLAAARDTRVKFLITHSPALDWRILRTHPDITAWREGEGIEFVSKSKGCKFKVAFTFFTDGLAYDAYGDLAKLKIPKLFLHSEKDEAIPLSFSQKAYELAAPPKKLSVLAGLSHSPTEPAAVNAIVNEAVRFLGASFRKYSL